MLTISAEQGLYVAIGLVCLFVGLFILTAGVGLLIYNETIRGPIAVVIWFITYLVAWVVGVISTLIFLKLALDLIAAPIIEYLALTFLS